MPPLKIGWVGVGVMGRWMCEHLMNGGHSAAVYSRTASKCGPLVAAGATMCMSPKEVAVDADVVFTMVGSPSDVESVTLGDDGVLAGLKPGGLLIACNRVALHRATPGVPTRALVKEDARHLVRVLVEEPDSLETVARAA